MTSLHRPYGTLIDGDDPVLLTPDDAGWRFAGLRVLRLHPGEPRLVATGDFEAFVLPLGGSCTVEVAGGPAFDLQGRQSVFHRVTDFCYVPREARIQLHSQAGAEVALPMARCRNQLEPRYGPAEDVLVEVRGAGNSTRQVTNFGVPGVWDHADTLIACELITPDGNWSSYPPHKHDDTEPCTVQNEEIYFFRIGGAAGGFGFHRTYTGDGKIDDNVAVEDCDVFLVPRGYHGPCVAAPGYPMYYLNVLAGPAQGRSMEFCDDPAHSWVRTSWESQQPDRRCPWTSADGRVHG